MGSGASRPQSVTPAERVRGLLQASHPFPIAMVVSLTLLGGIASARGEVPAGRLAIAVLSMLCSQLAIGWSNDYLDRETDARFQPSKPVPSGLVDAGWLPGLAAVSLVVSLGAAVALGWAVLAWLVAGTACGIAYNLRFKGTVLSWAPYVAAFAVLPPFVWSSTHSYRAEFLWLYPIGATLALAAHISNTLPDIEADSRAGTANLTVRLGGRGSLTLLYACLLAPPALIGISALWLNYQAVLLGVTLAAYWLLVAASVLAYRSRPFERGAAIGFRVVAPAAVILAAGWLAAL